MLEYKSEYYPALIKYNEYGSGSCPTLIKLKGLNIYVSLGVIPVVANWFWTEISFEFIWYDSLLIGQLILKFNMV